MTKNDPAYVNALLRNHLPAFIRKSFGTVVPGREYLHNWHIDAMAFYLEMCRIGKIKRLVITVPPRHLKSISASVAFPAWALGHDPSLRFICVSYGQELALKHALDCRAVMKSPWYQRLFPRTRIDPLRDTQAEFMTTKRGIRLATSIGGPLTGRGGNFIIIDDPHKPDEALSQAYRDRVKDWYRNTLFSRLDDKERDVVIVIQQRLHEDDLAGYLLAQPGTFDLTLPAIGEGNVDIQIGIDRLSGRDIIYTHEDGEPLHPARENLETLERIKAEIGSYAFAAQYQQRPAPYGGGMVKWHWFEFYDEMPKRQDGDQVVQSWDTAFTAEEARSYTVCTTWLIRANRFYLLDVFRRRLEYPELKSALKQQRERHWPDTLLIENKGSGTMLVQELRQEYDLWPIPIQPEADKATRMMTQTSLIEAGRVLLPREAPWLADFRHELVTFPNGRHDDQVDSVSQFLNWARDRGSGKAIFHIS